MPTYNLYVSRVHACNAIVPVLVFNIGNPLEIRTSAPWDLGSSHLRGVQAHAPHTFSDSTLLLAGTQMSRFIRLSSVGIGVVWRSAACGIPKAPDQIPWYFCAFFHEFWVYCSS